MTNKNELISKIIDLNLGDAEQLDTLSTDQLQSLYREAKSAQDAGKLNLETTAGVDNLQAIFNKYFLPF